jgi:hypothetical protein
MFRQTISRFYMQYYSKPWRSNSEQRVKQTCILPVWIARTEITGCNNHLKCSQLLCCPANMKSEISEPSSSDSYLMRKGYIIINYTYTVRPWYSFTVCSPQFVAAYRWWRYIWCSLYIYFCWYGLLSIEIKQKWTGRDVEGSGCSRISRNRPDFTWWDRVSNPKSHAYKSEALSVWASLIGHN